MFVEVFLRSIVIFFASIIKKRYMKTGRKSLFGHFIHYFMNRDMYDVYDEEAVIINEW